MYKNANFTGKESGLVADPHVVSVELEWDEDDFFVLACDGLWDVVTHAVRLRPVVADRVLVLTMGRKRQSSFSQDWSGVTAFRISRVRSLRRRCGRAAPTTSP